MESSMPPTPSTVVGSELPLDAPPLPRGTPLIPARMVNEYVYCPRLAYLEWVQGEWADNADTADGRLRHRNVDRARGKPPAKAACTDEDAEAEPERVHVHSLELQSEALGLVAKLDLAEFHGRRAVPVDYKRGKRPHTPHGAWEPERVQLCVQALLLEEHGYEVPEGVLYFVASRERVKVVFDDALRQAARSAAAGLQIVAAGGRMPPPLEGSPKCVRCSLAPICLPDEVRFLRDESNPTRPLAVSREPTLPLYVQARGAKVARQGDVLEVSIDDQKVAHARLDEVSQVVLRGGIYITSPALHELMSRQIPVTWLSHGGWFLGHTVGTGHKNVELRTAQYRASFDDAHCLRLARGLTAAKIRNQRTLLRRNWKRGEMPAGLLAAFRHDIDAAERAHDIGQLLGFEGNAAARYFGHFGDMLSRPDEPAGDWGFDFQRRTRRPPTDRVNALLSFAYAMLVRHVSVVLTAVGFDPYRGFMHQPRYGRPALALDLMEPMRPLLADSAVLMVINNGEVDPADFVVRGDAVNLDERGRRAFIAAFERRLGQEVTHPVFGYAAQWRQMVELQCRLLARHLLGEIDTYPNFVTR